MKEILLMTDFSEASIKAIRFAQHLFSDTPVAFDLLYAYPTVPEVMYETDFIMEEAEKEARQSVVKLLNELREPSIPAHHTYLTLTYPGDPVAAALLALERKNYDYVVVGATGAGRFPVLGSVATGLIRHAQAHVLVVPSHTTLKPIRNVVLAMDYRTLHQQDYLQPLQDLVTRTRAHLTALTVVDKQMPMSTGEAFEQYSNRLTEVFDSVNIDPYFIRDEKVENGIDTYLLTHDVDLLVTVPHRKSLLDALWNRSLTRQLAYHPRVPLLALYESSDEASLEAMIQQGSESIV
jgi:nucleotide-binding universal stress UspA family protein